MVDNEHITSDMYEAAYLKTLGFNPTFDRSEPNRVRCIFKGDKEFFQQRAFDFYEERAIGNMKTYADNLKALKKSILRGRPLK